jgi:hypothetical protein
LTSACKADDELQSLEYGEFDVKPMSVSEMKQIAIELGVSRVQDYMIPEESEIVLIRRRMPELGWGACVDLMHPSFLKAYDIHVGMVTLAVVANMSYEFKMLRSFMEGQYLEFAMMPKDGYASPWWISGCMMAIIEDTYRNPDLYTLMTVLDEFSGTRSDKADWFNITETCSADEIWCGYDKAEDLGSPRILDIDLDAVWRVYGIWDPKEVTRYGETRIHSAKALFCNAWEVKASPLTREIGRMLALSHNESFSPAELRMLRTTHALAIMSRIACGITACANAGMTPTLLCMQQRADLDYLLTGSVEDMLGPINSNETRLGAIVDAWRNEIVISLGSPEFIINIKSCRIRNGMILWGGLENGSVTHELVLFLRMVVAYGTSASSINVKELRWDRFTTRSLLHGQEGMLHTGIVPRGGTARATTSLLINYNGRVDVEASSAFHQLYPRASDVYVGGLYRIAYALDLTSDARINAKDPREHASGGAFVASSVSRILKSRLRTFSDGERAQLLPPPNVETRCEEMQAELIATNAESARVRYTQAVTTKFEMMNQWALRYGIGSGKASLTIVESVTDLIMILDSDDTKALFQVMQMPNVHIALGIPLWFHNVSRDESNDNDNNLRSLYLAHQKLMIRDNVIEAVGGLLPADDVREMCLQAVSGVENPLYDPMLPQRNPMVQILQYKDPAKVPRIHTELADTGALNALKIWGRRFGYECYPADVERAYIPDAKITAHSIGYQRKNPRVNMFSIAERLTNSLTNGGTVWNTDAILDIMEVLRMEVSVTVDMLVGPTAKSVHISLGRSTKTADEEVVDPKIAIVQQRSVTTGSVTFSLPGPLYIGGTSAVTPQVLVRHPITKDLVIGSPVGYGELTKRSSHRDDVDGTLVSLSPEQSSCGVRATSSGTGIDYYRGEESIEPHIQENTRKIVYGPSFGENFRGSSPFRFADLKFGPTGFVLGDILWGSRSPGTPEERVEVIKSIIRLRALNFTEKELQTSGIEWDQATLPPGPLYTLEGRDALSEIAGAVDVSRLAHRRGYHVEPTALRVHPDQEEDA